MEKPSLLLSEVRISREESEWFLWVNRILAAITTTAMTSAVILQMRIFKYKYVRYLHKGTLKSQVQSIQIVGGEKRVTLIKKAS